MPLHFANVELFSDFIRDHFLKVGSALKKVNVKNGFDELKEVEKPNGVHHSTSTLVLDGASIAYVDSMGIEALQNAFRDGQKVEVNVLFADFSGEFSPRLQNIFL
jgi:hypothetical protein